MEDHRQRAEKKEAFAHLCGFAVKNKKVFDTFLSKVPTEGRVLDVGCANGAFLKALREKGYRNLYAADRGNFISLSGLEEIPFQKINADFEQFPYPDNSFDTVTAFAVLEHLENPFFFVREASRLLKPEGLFVISIPNAFHIWSRLSFLLKGELTHWTMENEHISVFTKSIFQKIFSRYRTEAIVYSSGFIPYVSKLALPPSALLSKRACYFLRKP